MHQMPRRAWLVHPLIAALAVLATVALSAAPLSALAQSSELAESEVFTVRDVPVDVTAESAIEARRQALRDGQAEALARMLKRLTRRADHSALPRADAETAAFLVQGFQVANEKTSTVRYLADLTVRFKPVEVRRLLRQTGLPFAETASRPLVVLPVLRTPDGLVLWDAGNRWRNAWAALPVRQGLVPLVTPLGDLSDISSIDPSQAMLGEPEALANIIARYDAGGAVVALASLSVREDGLQVVDVAASRPLQPDAAPVLLTFTGASADEVDDLLQLSAMETAAGIEDAWLNEHLLRFDTSQTMTLAVPLSGLDDWVEVQGKLQSVAVISHIDLQVLRRDSAEVRVDFFGDEKQLVAALGQRGLVLEPVLPRVSVPEGAGAAFERPVETETEAVRVLRLDDR